MSPTQIKTRDIVRAVAAVSGVSVDEILGHVRTRTFVRARWVVFKLAREQGRTLPAIAKVCNRDHSTVFTSLERLAALLETRPDSPNARWLADVERKAREKLEREAHSSMVPELAERATHG